MPYSVLFYEVMLRPWQLYLKLPACIMLYASNSWNVITSGMLSIVGRA